jgi:hypothetical protein
LVASDGTVFERASTNAECCSTYSILESEDGTNARSPILVFKEGALQCGGGLMMTYQEWIDSKFINQEGICFEGWRYSKTGIYNKSASEFY